MIVPKASKKIIFSIIILFSLVFIILIQFVIVSSDSATIPGRVVVKVGKNIINATLADTPEAREKGLGGTKYLPEKSGMLFLFSEQGYHSFWMKDMIIPIDIVWINDNEIVDITENIPPPENSNNLPTYQPREPADKVLELNAGYAKRNGLRIGDKTAFEKTNFGIGFPRR